MVGKKYAVLVMMACALMGVNGCSGDSDNDDDLTSEEVVQVVFDNFQPTIAKITTNGLQAKDDSAATGANITPISDVGAEQGTMTIGGTVAQGSGLNENFDLWVQLDEDYGDTDEVFYTTDNTDDTTKLQFALHIINQPADNQMTGTLQGSLELSGDVEDTGTFDLTFTTDLDDDDTHAVVICSHVVGTVTTGEETLTVDFVLPEDTSGLDQAQIDKCVTL